MRREGIVLALVMVGCGGGGESTPMSDGGVPGADAANIDAAVENDAAPVFAPATRFELGAEARAVPGSGLPEGFHTANTATAFRNWEILDLDGDGRLDIVQSGDTAVDFRVWDAAGAPYWKVFLGSAGGMPQTATQWSVAKSGVARGFFHPALDVSPEHWQTVDMDGDGRPDLVQTMDPATSKVWDAAGSPHWKVYLGTAGGFAAEAISWSVPPRVASGFYATSTAEWTTVDLTGDGRPDLVETQDPVTFKVWDAAGSPHWKVFAGTGTGFAATAILWGVPVSGTTDGFETAEIASGATKWSLRDLDADGFLDLVQTCDPNTTDVWDAAGAPYWKIFRGGPGAFATSAVQWPVPTNGLIQGFETVSNRAATAYWTLFDLDGDGDDDLIQTADTAHAARVWDAGGTPYWKVWLNLRAGFAEMKRWNVPKIAGSEGLYAIGSALDTRHWMLGDVDGDGRADIVHFMDPATAKVWDASGSPYWKVYFGRP